MSAIAGYFHSDGNAAPPDYCPDMLDAMAHRSPDGREWRCYGPVVLGFGAFHTTWEEEAVREPFCLDRLALVFDGRLDNRENLIGQLGLPRESVPSDHELVLRAYRKWGEECPSRLEGVFAFALWAGPRLFCARDRFGIKPFNYYWDGRFFAFASEAKGLLPLPCVKDTLDEEQLCLHFHTELKIADQEKTYYSDIKRLPPAHSMTIGSGSLSTKLYWELDPLKETRYAREGEYYEHFTELLKYSVKVRMRSNRPVGSTLSGGLDSSSVTCIARDILKENNRPGLDTYSCVFDKASGSDEREWIDAVEEQGGLVPHHLHPDETAPLDDLEAMIRLHDGPFFGPNYYIQKSLFSAAAGQGHRVLLDGEDGDGIVSHGYDYLSVLAQRGEWDHFFREADRMAANFDDEKVFFSRSNLYIKYGHPYMLDLANRRKYLSLLKHINRIHSSINLSRKRYVNALFKKRTAPADSFESFLKEDLIRKYHIPERLRENKAREEHLSFPLWDNYYHYKGIVQSGNSYILEYLERQAGYYGIESRHPFFDRALAEYCLSLPPEVKLRDGLTRYHFREAMLGILPEKVRLRGGKGDLTHSAVRGYRLYNGNDIDNGVKSLATGDPLVDGKKAEVAGKAYMSDGDDRRLVDCWYLTAYAVWRKSAV